MREKPGFPAILAFLGSLAERTNGWLGREESNLEMVNWSPIVEIGRSRLSDRNGQESFPLKLVSSSKRSNFENRTR